MQKTRLSIVIPTCNEKNDGYLAQMAGHYPVSESLEYLIVDHKTRSETLERISRPDFHIHSVDAITRAERLNIGIQKSQGPMILCHHPRSLIDTEGLFYLVKNCENLKWGGFKHQFDQTSPGLLWTSWYSNWIRPFHSKVLYLDHCIYFRRELLNRPIPNIPIFEDTELSYILAELGGAPKVLPYAATTSAVRFQTNGFLKQAWMNQKLKYQFHRGRSAEKMNQQYEKNLNLNG